MHGMYPSLIMMPALSQVIATACWLLTVLAGVDSVKLQGATIDNHKDHVLCYHMHESASETRTACAYMPTILLAPKLKQDFSK
jgi:hypothetical protein